MKADSRSVLTMFGCYEMYVPPFSINCVTFLPFCFLFLHLLFVCCVLSLSYLSVYILFLGDAKKQYSFSAITFFTSVVCWDFHLRKKPSLYQLFFVFVGCVERFLYVMIFLLVLFIIKQLFLPSNRSLLLLLSSGHALFNTEKVGFCTYHTIKNYTYSNNKNNFFYY